MKILRVERLIIWGLLAALAAFSVFCIFWTPYDQTKLLRPIPANAVMISSHRNLGPRLESMATNIFFKSFLDSNETTLKNLRENRYAAQILSSRLMITAYVPDFNQFTTRGAWSSNPALVISSWVGGWSPVLRWALWIHPPKDIAALGDYNGHRLWACKKPVSCFGAVNYFSFAIDEGVFIGCLSRDRSGIACLMKNYDGRKDSILTYRNFNPGSRAREGVDFSGGHGVTAAATRNSCGLWPPNLNIQCRLLASSTVADQIWLRIDLPNAAQNKSFFAVCSLDVLENDYLAATIRFEPDTQASPEAPPRRVQLNDYAGLNQNLPEIRKIYACSPSIAALFPSDMVIGGLNGLISPAWAGAVRQILAPSSGTNNICLLTVLTGAYGGQFGKEPFRITVPTVLLAVSGARQEQTKAAVLELLDLINLKHRLGLILNSTLPPAGQCPIYAMESTASAPLNSLPVEDQPAFAFYNDWFLLASNSIGLRKLLISFQSQAVAADDGNNDWLKQADNRQKEVFVWIDPGEGGKALRFALTASIIMLDTDGLNPSKQNTIKIIKGLRAWLETISGLKNCAAWMESEDGKTVVRLEIGCKK